MRIPKNLVDAFREGNAAVFVGSGASRAAGLPTWQQLVQGIANDLDGELPEEPPFSPQALLTIPQYYVNENGRRPLVQLVSELLKVRRPSRIHQLLAALPADLFYTTNFDELLEAELGRDFPVIHNDGGLRSLTDPRGPQLRKLHGTLAGGASESIVLTRRDFARLRAHQTDLFDGLRQHLKDYTFLFVGYSMNDPDFMAIYDDVVLEMNNSEMSNAHYMTVPSINEYEKRDLATWNITGIDLRDWGGEGNGGGEGDAGTTSALEAFLTTLVEQTDDITHARRFFAGAERNSEVPLVVSSRMHEKERFVYIAECDLNVASQVGLALELLGCSAPRIADERALLDLESFRDCDVVCICSPFGNDFTKLVLEKVRQTCPEASVEFVSEGDQRYIQVGNPPQKFVANDPLKVDGTTRSSEYAFIGRYPNPWNPQRTAYIFAGLYAIGTHALGELLKDFAKYAELPNREGVIEAILEVRFDSHDPYDYKYESQPLEVMPPR